MKLKSLKVNNFRRFHGLHSMEFSTDEKKKYTLVHAENGTGKTNLLRAINWCLFDIVIDPEEGEDLNPTNNIHKVDVSSKTESLDCSVTLEVLNENNDTYKFRRKVTSLKNNSNKLTAEINGIQKTGDEASLMVEEILPRALSKYFLFHGEGLKGLTKKAHNINKAVEDIQGIGDALEVSQLLSSEESALNKKITSSSKASKRLKELHKRKESFDKAVDKIHKDLKKVEKEEKESLKDWEDLLEIDSKSDSKIRKEVAEQRKKDEKELEIKKEQLKAHELTKKTNITSHYAGLMGYEAALVCARIKTKMELDGRLPERLTKMLVQDILEREICICDRCVEPGSDAWKAIKKWEEVVGDPSLSMRLMDLASKDHEGIKNTDAFIESLKDHTNTSNVYETDIQKLKSSIAKAKEKLGGSDASKEEQNLEEKIQKAKELKDEAKNKLEIKQFQLIQKTKDREPIDREYNRLLQESTIDPVLVKQHQFLIACKERLDKIIKAQRATAQKRIVDKFQEMASRYFNKKVKVDFDQDFVPKLYEKVREKWMPIPPSTGERLLLNLCFVSSLVDVSSVKAQENESKFVIKGINPPVLIDAPFGDAVSYHEQITDAINTLNAGQVIIFLAKQYYDNKDFKKEIDAKVGKRYVLVSYMTEKDNEDLKKKHGEFKSNDHITINNKEYQQLFSTSEDGYTKIKEIANG